MAHVGFNSKTGHHGQRLLTQTKPEAKDLFRAAEPTYEPPTENQTQHREQHREKDLRNYKQKVYWEIQ